METYLDRIKLLKSEQRLTNEQFAERCGIPLGTLSKILAGMSDSPKLSTIMAMCSALGCSVEYIVSGTPENTNNYTLTAEEIALMEDYRCLDSWGRAMVKTVAEREALRAKAMQGESAEETVEAPVKSGRVLRPVSSVGRYAGQAPRTGKRKISLYDLPVSAGVGVYLEEEISETISIPNNEKTADADHALRISGNSMEPKYHDGDILLVQACDEVEEGELGIFLLDGSGFFKVYGGDRLISLNPDYAPILLKDFSEIRCKGRVVGKLKRK